jgi:hypothetical protein
VGTDHENYVLDQRKQCPSSHESLGLSAPVGIVLMMQPQFCLKIHFIARYSKRR